MGAIFDANFWQDLDADGLKHQKFVIRSEEDLPQHVDSIPSGVTIANIVVKYFNRAEKTRCIRCGMKRHRNGAVIALTNGDLALIGSKCGPDYFGKEEWGRAESAFIGAQKRGEGLRWADTFIENYETIKNSLILFRKLFSDFEAKSKLISDFFGTSDYFAIRNLCVRNGGALVFERRIESEQRIAALKQAKAKPDENGFFYDSVSLGRLEGGEIFSLVGVSSKIQSFIDEAAARLRDVKDEHVSTSKLSRGKKWYEDLKESINDYFDKLTKSVRFTSEKNLKIFLEWDRRRPSSAYFEYQNGNLLVATGENQRKISPALFDSLSLPPVPPTRQWP
jgi:hypothetical protein